MAVGRLVRKSACEGNKSSSPLRCQTTGGSRSPPGVKQYAFRISRPHGLGIGRNKILLFPACWGGVAGAGVGPRPQPPPQPCGKENACAGNKSWFTLFIAEPLPVPGHRWAQTIFLGNSRPNGLWTNWSKTLLFPACWGVVLLVIPHTSKWPTLIYMHIYMSI